jgi:hypothetical protein
MAKRWVAVVVALGLLAGACGGDDDDDDSTETTEDTTTDASGSVTTASADQGCPTTHSTRLALDAELRLALVACRNAAGTEIWVESTSAGVVHFSPQPDSPIPSWRFVTSRLDGLSRQAVDGVGVPAVSSSSGDYYLWPRSVAVASAGQALALQAEFDETSALAYTAVAVSDWVAAKLQTAGQRFLSSVVDCATGASGLLGNNDPTYWEDTLRQALQTVGPCATLANAMREERAVTVEQAADDLARAGRRFSTAWDDLVRLIARGATFFPR